MHTQIYIHGSHASYVGLLSLMIIIMDSLWKSIYFVIILHKEIEMDIITIANFTDLSYSITVAILATYMSYQMRLIFLTNFFSKFG